MKRRVRVKPGKTQSMMGMVVGIIFCLIGLVMVIPTFGLFGLFWTAIAVAITVTNGINAFSEKGVPTHEIYVDEYEENHGSSHSYGTDTYADGTARSWHGASGTAEEGAQSVKERLETVKKLYEDGIITREEYEEKRRQLIDEI